MRNYVRKPIPPCPVCGVTMRITTQRSYVCPSHGLVARYPRGRRDTLKIFGLTVAGIDDWICGIQLGTAKSGDLMFLKEVRVR